MIVLLPAVQYGASPDVKRRMRSIVSRLMRGEGIVEAMSEGGLIDVAERPGWLLCDGATRGSEPNFHVGLPWLPLWQKLVGAHADAAVNDAIFRASLGSPWGVLGILSRENHPWLVPETRFQPFLDAVLEFWPELDAVGERYYSAVEARRLWNVPNNLHFVLANMGVPNDVLRAPLPPGGPRALLQYARPIAEA